MLNHVTGQNNARLFNPAWELSEDDSSEGEEGGTDRKVETPFEMRAVRTIKPGEVRSRPPLSQSHL